MTITIDHPAPTTETAAAPSPSGFETLAVVPAEAFVTAWLNVSAATSRDESRPSLCSVALEFYDSANVRLVGTDSYILLSSWVGTGDDPGWLTPPARIVAALDDDRRVQALARWLSTHRRAKGLTVTIAVSNDRVSFDIGDQVVRVGRPFAGAYGEFPNWRHMLERHRTEPTETVHVALGLLEVVSKMRTTGPGRSYCDRHQPARIDLAGRLHAITVTVPVTPPVQGLVMPVRVDR
jgi:hypothetical protein